jgi:hypothetical protein
MEHVWQWVSEHKLWAAGIVFGVIVLIWLWWRSGSSSASSGSGANAYYAAAAQNAQADAALQAQQAQTQAAMYAAQQQATTQQEAYQAAVQMNASNNATQASMINALIPVYQSEIAAQTAQTNAAATSANLTSFYALLAAQPQLAHSQLFMSTGLPLPNSQGGVYLPQEFAGPGQYAYYKSKYPQFFS